MIGPWQERIPALVIAALLGLAMGAYVVVRGRWASSRGDSPSSRSRARLEWAFLPLAPAFLMLTAYFGAVQDYWLYLQIWGEVRLGHDPWWIVYGVFGEYPLNAYGPLFNTLAPLARLEPLLPKLLFTSCYLGYVLWLLKDARAREIARRFPLLCLAWFWCPYVWVEIPRNGHFDVLVAALCVAALEARRRESDLSAGLLLGLGVLLKYMPIVLLPFLALDRGRVRVRLVLWAVLIVGSGLAIAEWVWGNSAFRPLYFAATRGTHHLSIYRYLRGELSPTAWVRSFCQRNDRYAPVLLFVALLRAWSWSRVRRADVAGSSVLGLLTTLLFYQVGFAQYQMVLFFLISYWFMRCPGEIRRPVPLVVAAGCYFAWLSAFDVVDAKIGLDNTSMQEWVGLPTFLLGMALLVCVVRSTRTGPALPCNENARAK